MQLVWSSFEFFRCFVANKFRIIGVQLAENLNDEDDNISLEGLHPNTAERKLEKKLEELLAPASRSIIFTLTITKKNADARKQRPNIVNFLDTFVSLFYVLYSNH